MKFPAKVINILIKLQEKYSLFILFSGIALTSLATPRAVGLLTNVKTDLINLLPDHYPTVHYTDEIQKKFNRRSSLYIIINSPDAAANQKAMFAAKDFLTQRMPSIDFIEIEKRGYDFFDKNKLLLIELKDLYQIHDRLKDKLNKGKLGGLYIDFEGGKSAQEEVSFDDLIKKYKEEFADGVKSRYKTNELGTVYVLNIYPKSTDDSLSYFKKFGEEVDAVVKEFDFKQFHPQMEYGYAGAIITRVDQYVALMRDLKKAGLISSISIFVLLYAYFGRFVHRKKGWLNFFLTYKIRIIPVIAIFIPMIMSTIFAFWFCSFFFSNLNIVTSFLFAIIFGLGVDIGIHMITRYIQDRSMGMGMDTIHRDVLTKTGGACAISILTTVASFYALTINEFKGFTEFGWIAGNGLIIALLCYLLFFPCVLHLLDRLPFLKFKDLSAQVLGRGRHPWIPRARALFVLTLLFLGLSFFGLKELHFEWDFNKLKMKLPEREHLKDLLKETHGRANSPAVYLVENQVEARKLRQVLREREENDPDFPTIHFYRSYYDMVPFDQEEKLALLGEIDVMLKDEALKTLKDDEKKLVSDFQKAIAETKRVRERDIDPDVNDLFWGNTGHNDTSVAYIMPLPELELDNGEYAHAFYDDVHIVRALGKKFYALSDSIVFAEVLITLFRDSKVAITLASIVIVILIVLHFRDVKRTSFVLLGLFTGIMWMLGIMALFDLRLNFYNMIVIPSMIGMGEDNSVHIVHRFDEVGRKSIINVLKTSGGAALMASLTTMFGFAGMCFTNHPGLNSIGWMAIIGMGTCLIASLGVLPLLLQLFLRDTSAHH